MKKLFILTIILSSTLIIIACGQDTGINNSDKQDTGVNHSEKDTYTLDLSDITYTPVQDEDTITVNDQPITIPNRIISWDTLDDIILDKPVEEFDKIDTMSLSDLTWYTMIYSVPSLDTPVCTLQTKQIEAAAKQFPEINFVIVSHDTPFALARFCLKNDITNVMTLSDSRRKEFAIENGLYMSEYDLMTRAILIVDDNLNVVYVDYADEVTGTVDLLNAFAVIKNLEQK